MKLYTENQGIHTYLTYEVSAEDDVDTMSLGMITNNHIEGIAPVIYTHMDSDMYLKYNISAKVPVSEFFRGAVSRKRLLGVFSSIMSAVMSAEEYMIDLSTLLFDLDYMYVDVTTCKAEMICVPLMNGNQEVIDLSLFFKNIMFSTQFDHTENSDYVAKIMNYLNSSPNLNPADFKQMIDNLINNVQDTPQMGSMSQQPTVNARSQAPQPQVAVPTPAPAPTVASAQPEQGQPQTLNPQMQAEVSGNPHKMSVADKEVLKAIQPSKKEKNKKNAKETPAMVGMQVPNMNIPGQNVQPSNPQPQQDTGEKMSWLYLMQHYNKENAAIYKAQKENKSTAKAPKKAKTPVQAGFTVPGALGMAPQQNKGMQIPGKTNTPPTNGTAAGMGFAIPGQVAPAVNSAPQPSIPTQNVPTPQPQTSGMGQPVAPQPTFTPDPLGQANANFGETVVLNAGMAGAGETTVLGASAEPMEIIPYLMRAKNNEKILLNKPVFRLGKEKSYVDYFIGDNTAISRSHANVLSRDGEYYVVDTNSTNHTYVNGAILQSNVETKISHGDKIRLANEDFTFNLY